MQQFYKASFQVLCGVLLLMSVGQIGRAQIWADLVLYNGKILTADSPDPANFSTAEAVAIYDGKFVGVGTSQEMLRMAGPETRKADLEGRTVVPGFIDTHVHLQDYAARQLLGHGGPAPRSNWGMTDGILWNNKQDGLAQLRTVMLKKKPGEWAVVQPTFTEESNLPNLLAAFPTEFVNSMTLADLDRIAPNNPLVLSGYAYDYSLANSKALEPILKRFPNLPGVYKDASGKPTGYIVGAASRAMELLQWPDDDPEFMADGFRQYAEHYPFMAVTTVSTRMARNPLRGFQLLDARGQMPVRLAYSEEMLADFPDPEMGFRLFDTALGAGTPMVWFIGHSMVQIDLTTNTGGSCFTKEYPRESVDYPLWRFQFFGPNGDCNLRSKDHTQAAGMELVLRNGGRIVGTHDVGDGALDDYLNILESLENKYHLNLKERHNGVDHCGGYRLDQMERAKQFEIAFSCYPASRSVVQGVKEKPEATEILFGPEVGAQMMTPFRKMIDVGLHPSMETDSSDYYSFLAAEKVITRKLPSGRILGPEQRINRQEALYTYTRWAAEYVVKGKEIGSIEKGKWADLAVLDRDFLTIPEEDIHNIDVLMTVLGGKIVYTEPKFATVKSLPQVGFRGDPRTFTRGRLDDRRSSGG